MHLCNCTSLALLFGFWSQKTQTIETLLFCLPYPKGVNENKTKLEKKQVPVECQRAVPGVASESIGSVRSSESGVPENGPGVKVCKISRPISGTEPDTFCFVLFFVCMCAAVAAYL